MLWSHEISNNIYQHHHDIEPLPNGNFLLITSASHMRRAMMCFKKSELKVTPFPTDCTKSSRSIGVMYILSPRIEALDQWETLIKEWVGYIVYSIAF